MSSVRNENISRARLLTETIFGYQVCSSIHECLDVANMAVLGSNVERSPALSPGAAGCVDPGPGLQYFAILLRI